MDSLGNIYIGANIATFPVDTGRFIKIDGLTGQTVFNIPFIDAQIRDVIVDGNYVYILNGPPLNQISKYDLNGLNVWSKPLNNPQSPLRIYEGKNNTICVIGENLFSATDSYFQFERYSAIGIFIDAFTLNPSPIWDALVDYKVDSNGKFWFTSESYDATTYSVTHLHILDSTVVTNDTIINGNPVSRNSRIDISPSNVAYINAYTSLPPTSKLYKFDTNLQYLNSIDSAFSESNILLGGDIFAGNPSKVFTVNSKRKIFTDTDYEISCFDTVGNLEWNLNYSLNAFSREKPFKIFTHINDLYISGLISDSVMPIYGINLLKINLITSSFSDENQINNFEIFPNPLNTSVLYFNSFIINSDITIINSHGLTLAKIIDFSGDKLNLNEYELKNGLYFIRIQDKNEIILKKLMII
ncbi:MAG: T9SS type A sorting domain-containing protein [Bacteroidota bacterium]|nr:T9SS type A sorting domain-containing protein [Bacteroidota bacterium]